jgi:nucleoside-diphosphate-sugar epimerase
MRTLVIGCGYVGSALAMELARQGHFVDAIRRSAHRDERLETAGVRTLQADIADPRDLAKIHSDYQWIVNCVAPSSGDAEAYERVYLQGMRNLVDHFSNTSLQKLVYTSSSGVYAQDDGSLVDESCTAVPESATGRVLRQAEEVLLQASREARLPGVVLRVSGIYGPGRTYWLRMFLSGEAMPAAGDRYMNMIHRDDVVGALIAALEKGRAGEVYNVTDNEPVRQSDLFTWLAEKTGRPAPAPESGPRSPAPSSRRTVTNKRISNRKLREELGYTLKHPTFREGYTAEMKNL